MVPSSDMLLSCKRVRQTRDPALLRFFLCACLQWLPLNHMRAKLCARSSHSTDPPIDSTCSNCQMHAAETLPHLLRCPAYTAIRMQCFDTIVSLLGSQHGGFSHTLNPTLTSLSRALQCAHTELLIYIYIYIYIFIYIYR